MRMIPSHERKQRGCEYCIHGELTRFPGVIGQRIKCPYPVCPYHVLDKYKSYDEFMASEDSKILVDGFFSTVADCYAMQSGNKSLRQIFMDVHRQI